MKSHRDGELVEVTGGVAEAYWDDVTAMMRVAVITEDDKDFLILPDEMGQDLAGRVGDHVVVDGVWRKDASGRPSIEVDDFSVIYSPASGEMLGWEPTVNDGDRWWDRKALVRAMAESWPIE